MSGGLFALGHGAVGDLLGIRQVWRRNGVGPDDLDAVDEGLKVLGQLACDNHLPRERLL